MASKSRVTSLLVSWMGASEMIFPASTGESEANVTRGARLHVPAGEASANESNPPLGAWSVRRTEPDADP